MISEIQINQVATYNSPVSLNNLRKVNFFFGANGSGKTTISRIIDRAEKHEHCPIKWMNDIPLQVMVYNRDFVEGNFNQENTVKGVFTLGDNQVEAEKEILQLQPTISKLEQEISSIKVLLRGNEGHSGKYKEVDDLEAELEKDCWEQKKLHDSYFAEAFTGYRNSALKFKEKVLTEKQTNTAEINSLDKLKELAETVFSKTLQSVAMLAPLNYVPVITLESSNILTKIIVGSQDVDIAGLINKLGNSDWVKQGVNYHQLSPDICPFCQQPTNEDFDNDLRAFFNESFENDIRELRHCLESYKKASDVLQSSIENNLHNGNTYLEFELFQSEASRLAETLKNNIAIIESKCQKPSQIIELTPISPNIEKLNDLIKSANISTSNHNRTVSNIENEKAQLKASIWGYVLNELKNRLAKYEKSKNTLKSTIIGMESNLSKKRDRLTELVTKLSELEKQSTSIIPTKDAINGLLKSFGFDSFYLDVVNQQGHYKICRKNGDDASRSLSEGEKTFITFLYFYSLIKGSFAKSGTTSNRVVVFDDPISSLDSDILYIVSSLIKSTIEEVDISVGFIKQIFILTHNVYFHKEVTFDTRRNHDGVLNRESFWMVKKQLSGSTVVRCTENPINSAYELLWNDIKDENISSCTLQNTLRRVLENYFTMWGGMGKDKICNLFDGKDKLICSSLFSWINDGSHSILDDLYINHGEQTNTTYLRVFRDIFEKSNQIGHYNMMTGQCEKSPIDEALTSNFQPAPSQESNAILTSPIHPEPLRPPAPTAPQVPVEPNFF